MITNFASCTLCPRQCRTDRNKYIGFCKSGVLPKLAKADIHLWEEPCISGKNGSGAIFFSGCTMGCVFCQNNVISQDGFGSEVTIERLGEIMLELQTQGAHNINLVTPTHFVPQIIKAYESISQKLIIPIVYNTSGYETVDTIKALDGIVDVFLPDFKYITSKLSISLSNCCDYFEKTTLAIEQMVKQTRNYSFDEAGNILKGTIIRHLVLPGEIDNSKKVLEYISKTYENKILVSIMSQYTPDFYHGSSLALKRRLTQKEYDDVIDFAINLNLDGFVQELSSSDVAFTPSFDLKGIMKE